MNIRDRIKEFRRVPAAQLRPSPRNWRRHPDAQANTLRALLADIGIADAVIARELPDGALELIDGHLRTETLGESLVPVLVLDVNEAEANRLLMTLDPLAAMAETDRDALESLMELSPSDIPEIRNMMAQLAESEGITPPDFMPAGVEEQGRLDQIKPVKCPNCGHEFRPNAPKDEPATPQT